MRANSFAKFVGVLAAITLFGCSSVDTPSAPPAVSLPEAPASHSLLGTLLGAPKVVTPLTRTTPLAAPISVSRTIGVLGGTIIVPGTGLSVVVPPLAVLGNTTFTVTAFAGSAVAYDFGPSGKKFAVPLVATQDLRGTNARTGGSINPLSLFAGYFPDASKPTSITEILNVGVNLLSQTSVFSITHFSGYIVACGDRDEL